MSSTLNPVQTTITVGGKPCHFVHIKLHQTFNNHHTFQIKLDYDQLDTLWMNNPVQIIQLIGKEVNITMMHLVTGETNLFNGIISDVSMNGTHGEQNFITVSGCSPTIKLDGTPTMDSFMDLNLTSIVEEAVGTSGNGAEVDVKPVFGGTIDYICQYDETAFDFLNRLSWLYGEWFFYDGTSIHFGKPDVGEAAVLVYDEDITEFDLRAKLIPPKVNRYEYLNHDVNEINSKAPDTVDGVRGYIKVALDQSSEVYTSEAVRPLESSILSKKELDDLVKVDKYRMVSQMLTMHAKTETCKVKIGKLVSVNLPKSMRVPLKHVETFLVTDLLHEIDQDGTYINTFSAIPSEMENIPMQPISPPKALPQVAWVKSNADPKGKGRVTVQLQWQKQINKTTNWVRVQTPDGGSSSKVAQNRGFVFVPEEGDQVMMGFENGDPNRPYISGAIFPENVSTGGGSGNKGKSLTSRSGSTVTLDDETGSVLIADQTGNDSITIDGKNKISINTTKIIELNNGQSSITMTDDTIVISSANITIGGTKFVILKSGTAETSVKAEGNIVKTTGDSNIVSSEVKTDVNGPTIDVIGSNITVKGSKDINIEAPMVKINS